MDNVIPKTKQKRIVIVGCGFGGLKLAKSLKDVDVQVVLIDRLNYHQFQPLFYQVATSGIEPSAISFPIRKIFQKQTNLYFRVTEVLNIRANEKRIETGVGVIDYDFLVLATGATSHFFGLKNLQLYSFPMKTTAESIILRNKLLQNFEDAVSQTDEAVRKALLNIVIIGGGPTGVEIAGALAEMRQFIIPKDFKEINLKEVKITLVEAGAKVLQYMTIKASMKTEHYLTELGVTIEKNSQVTDYDGETLTFASGKVIHTKTVIWAAGIAGNIVSGINKETIGRGNRIIVNEFNKVEGYDSIFAIGDIALMKGDTDYASGHPQVAPVAIQQAEFLAKNIQAIIAGKEQLEAFKYRNLGTMATVGRNHAVVEFKAFKYYGFMAWATWLFVHLMSIVGTKNRLFTFINWMWNYFTYDQSLRLIIRTGNNKSEPQTPKKE